MRDLAGQLAALWRELERVGAVVNRVPLDSPEAVLQGRIAHESRRLRALGEREAS